MKEPVELTPKAFEEDADVQITGFGSMPDEAAPKEEASRYSHAVFLDEADETEAERWDEECKAIDNDYFLQSFSQICKRVNTMAKEKGWWEAERNDGEMIALMHSELSEGLEALRKDLQSDHIPGFKGIEEELADVIIRIMDFAIARGLRLPEAILAKIAFNATRPHRHGGKKF